MLYFRKLEKPSMPTHYISTLHPKIKCAGCGLAFHTYEKAELVNKRKF